MSHLKRLINEIHRRSVWQVVGIYLLGGWIALQVVETLVDSLGLPEWFPAFAVMLLIVGFPIVVATAFVQEGVGGAGHGGVAPGGSGGGEPGTGAPHGGLSGAPRGDGTEGPTSGAANLASGTGSLDRPSTRPPRLYRMLTWRNAIGGGVVAFALWGVVAAAWMGMNAYVDRQLGEAGATPATSPITKGEAAALKSVAVLPFENLSPDQENAFFADGVHEDVLTQLSKVGDLVVISRTSVLAYRDTDRTLSEIGQELGVGSIVEGSVRRSGDNVRITAQLIDAKTDRHLWAENFDRALTAANVFAIQTEIAERIAAALAATLSPAEADRLERNPTENLDAYLSTLRGREAYRLYTDAGNNEAIERFKLAIQLDLAYAEPWAGLADAYGQRVLRYGYPVAWADSSEAAARRALELEPDLATAHKALGNAYVARGDDQAALEANRRAIELDPNYADPLNNLGVTLQRLGRLDEAHAFFVRSFRLQPNLAFARSNVAFSYAELGEFDIAHARLDEALRFDPGDIDARAYKAFVHLFQGDAETAADLCDRVLEGDPDNPLILAWAADANLFAGRLDVAASQARHSLDVSRDQDAVGWRTIGLIGGAALIRLGETADGRAMVEEVLARRRAEWESGNRGSRVAFEVASAHAALGDEEEAISWMETASEAGWRFAFYVQYDPVFEALQGDPHFQDVLQRMLNDVERMRLNVERQEREEGQR